MAKRRRIPIPDRPQRALLSDTLPYEVPLTFSNRGMYDFLTTYDVALKGKQVTWCGANRAVNVAVKTLFGVCANAGVTPVTITQNGRVLTRTTLANPKADLKHTCGTIPFSYRIRHKEDRPRQLSVPHPYSQMRVVELYEAYRDLVLYYCKQSPFSIRYPRAVARTMYHRDSLHVSRTASGNSSVEQYDEEYDIMRSYFVYQRYSNIYKFYESYQFHRLEQKFDRMIKIDIAQCFDSVYTHSVAWAIVGKDVAKHNRQNLADTLPGAFDRIMQQMNYGETNGIIIGPEVSRIFAEIILQHIDRRLMLRLTEADPARSLRNKRDYDICRYVDDYFIFYNSEEDLDRVMTELETLLSESRFHLNIAKSVRYDKPIITNVSMAKYRVSTLLESRLGVWREADDGSSLLLAGLNESSLITQFKTIIRECQVDYRDMLNYTLSIVQRKAATTLRLWEKSGRSGGGEGPLASQLLGMLRFTFFVYSVAPRVNTTIKLCQVIVTITRALRSLGTSKDLQHQIFKVIHENVCLVLGRNCRRKNTQVESQYLLIALSDLGRDYWLDARRLEEYFGVAVDGSVVKFGWPLDYFSITVLLFYMKDKVRYKRLREALEREILRRLGSRSTDKGRSAESVMLLLDTIACPYIRRDVKREALDAYGIGTECSLDALQDLREYWFTRWTGFDILRELDSKRGFDVY